MTSLLYKCLPSPAAILNNEYNTLKLLWTHIRTESRFKHIKK